MVEQEMTSLRGGAIIPELCVYFSIWQVDCTWIYFISSVFCKLHFIVYYGRQLRQSTTVLNYGFLSHIPRKGN